VNRFFIEKINPQGKQIILSDPGQIHHLRDVLRVKLLEPVAVFDYQGNEVITCVKQIKSGQIELEVKEIKPARDPGLRITVACAIPKKVKMDDIVDKLTQLGVERIIPLETERVIVRLDKQKKAEKRLRWEKISMSAAKQSQRNTLPLVSPVTGLPEVVYQENDFDLKLIPTLEGRNKNLKEALEQDKKKVKKIIILIGPEGDFTPDEVVLAKGAGFLPVSLGKDVLRVDTAAIAAVSFIRLNEAA